MKNLWFGFWNEFGRVFGDPREWHRVLGIIFLSSSLSHAIYVYYTLPLDYIWVTSDTVSITMGTIATIFILCWCFFSNEMNIDLFNRFAIVGGLSGLFHRMIFYTIELGDPYFVTLAIIAFLLFGIWALTGKSYRELKLDYIGPAIRQMKGGFVKHEKKDNVRIIHDSAIGE